MMKRGSNSSEIDMSDDPIYQPKDEVFHPVEGIYQAEHKPTDWRRIRRNISVGAASVFMFLGIAQKAGCIADFTIYDYKKDAVELYLDHNDNGSFDTDEIAEGKNILGKPNNGELSKGDIEGLYEIIRRRR